MKHPSSLETISLCVSSLSSEENIVVSGLNRPRTSYMLSKIVGEVMCQHCGVPFTIFRPHNIYGPRMGMAHVIPELLRRVWDIQSPQPLEVYSVDHCRSFCYIDDAIEMLVRMLHTDACDQKTLNLGTESPEVTMRDLAQICIDLIDKNLTIKPMMATSGSPHRRAPNMSLTRGLIKYESKIGLEQGIEDPVKELDVHGVYRMTVGGSLTQVISDLPRPNGIAFSPDQGTLYVSNSGLPPVIMAYDVTSSGDLNNGRVFYQSWGDGLAIDQQGNVYVAGPDNGVLIISPAGELLGSLNTTQRTSNCAFGDDGYTLYITSDMHLLRIRLNVKGVGF